VARRLSESAVSRIARPGKVTSHQAVVMYCRPCESISPQDDCGGWIPRPRKLKAASVRIM
jgi:hypothetical protein